MNIADSAAIRACTSCQMCGAVCGQSAITIKLDEDGFYRPFVESGQCIDCGLCVKVCNRFDADIKDTEYRDLDRTILYAASAYDDAVVRETTSGGIGDLLAKELIREGFKVVGVVYDSIQDCALHQVADTIEQTDAFRGSKYIQSYSVDAFRQVVTNAKKDKFAIFGLPCQIYAVSRFLEGMHIRDRHLLVDLYCHGCPTMFAWEKVSQHIRTESGVGNFSNVRWRSKLRGWGKYVLEVEKDGKRIYNSTPKHNEFFNLFFCNQVLNESCIDCKLRSTLAYTDIRMGDYWGKLYYNTTRGMSGISVCTERGANVFEQLKSKIKFEQKSYDTFLPYQSWNHVYKVDAKLRSELMIALRDPDKSIMDVRDILCASQTMSDKIKIFVKQIMFNMPLTIEKQVRKII